MPRSAPPDVGLKIKEIRSHEKLTLDQLAKMSGVSKSMLSQIERGRTNPTLGTLWSLTRALGIDLPTLLNNAEKNTDDEAQIEETRSHEIPEIKSADSKCTLRILGPIDKVSEVEWYEMTLLAGGRLASQGHSDGTIEHVTVQEGELAISNGGREVIVAKGDTARYDAHLPHVIENRSNNTARALMVVLAK